MCFFTSNIVVASLNIVADSYIFPFYYSISSSFVVGCCCSRRMVNIGCILIFEMTAISATFHRVCMCAFFLRLLVRDALSAFFFVIKFLNVRCSFDLSTISLKCGEKKPINIGQQHVHICRKVHNKIVQWWIRRRWNAFFSLRFVWKKGFEFLFFQVYFFPFRITTLYYWMTFLPRFRSVFLVLYIYMHATVRLYGSLFCSYSLLLR